MGGRLNARACHSQAQPFPELVLSGTQRSCRPDCGCLSSICRTFDAGWMLFIFHTEVLMLCNI